MNELQKALKCAGVKLPVRCEEEAIIVDANDKWVLQIILVESTYEQDVAIAESLCNLINQNGE